MFLVLKTRRVEIIRKSVNVGLLHNVECYRYSEWYYIGQLVVVPLY